ncbi:MAG: MFS transporter, partial [Thermodesulfobacteriota bacterium]
MPTIPQPGSKWGVFVIVACGVFMATLDSSIVNIALPSIMASLHAPLHRTEWVVMIYLVTISASLLWWGALSDAWGRRGLYSLGMLLFAAGSLACALAASIGWLIAARWLQALGAAMMMAIGPAIIGETFPKNETGRAFGLIGVVVSWGLMTGPALGGFLVEHFSWRAIFLVTVPVGLVFSLLARAQLPAPVLRPHTGGFDWRGACLWG